MLLDYMSQLNKKTQTKHTLGLMTRAWSQYLQEPMRCSISTASGGGDGERLAGVEKYAPPENLIWYLYHALKIVPIH